MPWWIILALLRSALPADHSVHRHFDSGFEIPCAGLLTSWTCQARRGAGLPISRRNIHAFVECRSKKHKEKLAALQEALREDAALGGEDLLSDILPPADSQPESGSKQQLKSEIHTRRHQPTAARQDSFAASAHTQAASEQGRHYPQVSEYKDSCTASEASQDDLSEDAMLARLIEVQQGGAGLNAVADSSDDEDPDDWEHIDHGEVHHPVANSLEADLTRDLQDLHVHPEPNLQAETSVDDSHDANPDAAGKFNLLSVLFCFACLIWLSSCRVI